MKPTRRLPFQIDARFARYAILTGAAMLAAKPATASVVVLRGSGVDFSSGSHSLDANNDGFVDFVFSGFGASAPGASVEGFSSSFIIEFGTGTATGINFAEVMVDPSVTSNALALGIGDVVGSDFDFNIHAGMTNFTATGPRFLGIEFLDSSRNSFFGFVEFDPFHFEGLAFETSGDSITTFDLRTPATAPEPGSLGLLALGAAALELLRRKRANRA